MNAVVEVPKRRATSNDSSGVRGNGNPKSDASIDAPDLRGKVIGSGYRIENCIGQGAMGAIYRACQIGSHDLVAVKILKPELSSDWAMVRRFRREAKASRAINSPQVVKISEYGETDSGQLFMVMELLHGASLADHLARHGALNPGEAVHIGLEVARALAAAHAVGVVHRDLKPDNVMLTVDGEVKVVDFGIAKVQEADTDTSATMVSKLTMAGSIVGTPMYMSPEAVARRPVGPAADLYALGVTLFEMLVGRPPFEDDQPVLLMGMHLRVPPELITQAKADLDIPDPLEALVDQLLAKEPTQRPESAAAVVRELERIGVMMGSTLGAIHNVVAYGRGTLVTPVGPELDAMQREIAERAARRPPFDIRDVEFEDEQTRPAMRAPGAQGSPSGAQVQVAGRHPFGALAPEPDIHGMPTLRPGAVRRRPKVWAGAAAIVLATGLVLAALAWPSDPVSTSDEIGDVAAEELVGGAPMPVDRAADEDGERGSMPTPEAPVAVPFGAVEISANVACTVAIDGEAIGSAPLRDHGIAAGSHTVACRSTTHGEASATLVVAPDETAAHHFELAAPEPAAVQPPRRAATPIRRRINRPRPNPEPPPTARPEQVARPTLRPAGLARDYQP